jgi:hypothetical protein
MQRIQVRRMTWLGMVAVLAVASVAQPVRAALWSSKWVQKMEVTNGIFVGVNWVNFEHELNPALRARGLDDYGDAAVTAGLFRLRSVERLMIESEIAVMLWTHRHEGGVETNLYGGELIGQLGFNVMPVESNIRVFPMVGLGWGLLRLRFTETQKTFDVAASENPFSSVMWQSTLLVPLTLGVDYTIKMRGSDAGLRVGVMGGYILDVLSQDTWWQQGTTVEDAPDAKMGGFYVRGTIGIPMSYGRRCKGVNEPAAGTTNR